MAKLSKSKTPKYELIDGDNDQLELEPLGEESTFLFSMKGEEDEQWRAVTVSIDQLREMLEFAERHS